MGKQQPTLTAQRARDLLHAMMRIRRFEEACIEQYYAGNIRGFLHLCIGQEAIAVGVMQALQAEDAVVATYREHGHALARGVDMQRVMAELFGKREGCSRGRGGSMHLFDAETRFYGGYAIVGGGLPIAVGLALADNMQGRNHITACFFGEGAVAEGEFHESLNLAALWRLPVLFLCENNRYAMGTALERSESQIDIAAKASGYLISAKTVDGMDVLAVCDAAREASEYIRAGHGPYFLELQSYRFRAHSMFDPERYRDKTEVEAWKTRGPVVNFAAHVQQQGLLRQDEIDALQKDVDEEVDAAIAFAEAGQWEPLTDLTRDVYAARQ